MIVIDGNTVLRGQEIIIKLKNEIEGLIEIGDKLVLLEKSHGTNDNLVCFNSQGTELWRVSNSEYFHETCPVLGMNFENRTLIIYRKCGVEEEIDYNTGEIIRSELIK